MHRYDLGRPGIYTISYGFFAVRFDHRCEQPPLHRCHSVCFSGSFGKCPDPKDNIGAWAVYVRRLRCASARVFIVLCVSGAGLEPPEPDGKHHPLLRDRNVFIIKLRNFIVDDVFMLHVLSDLIEGGPSMRCFFV